MKVTELSYEEVRLIRRRRKAKALRKRLRRTFMPTQDQLIAIVLVIASVLMILNPPQVLVGDEEFRGIMLITTLCGSYAYFHMLKKQAEKYLFYYC